MNCFVLSLNLDCRQISFFPFYWSLHFLTSIFLNVIINREVIWSNCISLYVSWSHFVNTLIFKESFLNSGQIFHHFGKVLFVNFSAKAREFTFVNEFQINLNSAEARVFNKNRFKTLVIDSCVKLTVFVESFCHLKI